MAQAVKANGRGKFGMFAGISHESLLMRLAPCTAIALLEDGICSGKSGARLREEARALLRQDDAVNFFLAPALPRPHGYCVAIRLQIRRDKLRQLPPSSTRLQCRMYDLAEIGRAGIQKPLGFRNR